jgi:hypothetical protein
VPDLNDREAGTYASLDMLAPNVITRNRFRCDHGWDIDLDDGSSQYIITENLCLHGGLKLREGFRRTVKHNITIDNSVHFHVWYPASEDIVEENILFQPYMPIGMPENWGESVGKNILHTPGTAEVSPAEALQKICHDDHGSLCLDAGFTDPFSGNYVPTHPLLTAFADFPTEFGVRWEKLRRIADTPVLPGKVKETEENAGAGWISWYGMTGKNIETDGEMSVYGTAEHSGVIVCSVEKDSPAEKVGLLAGDVLVAVREKRIRDTDGLQNTPFPEHLTVLRNQKETILHK